MDPVTTAVGISAAVSAVSGIVDAISKGSEALKDPSAKGYFNPGLVSTNGSITKLLSKFIVEPTIIISTDLKDEEITEKVANVNVDMFASYYLQAFEVLRTMYGMNENMIIDVLGTGSASGNIKSSVIRAGSAALTSSRESFEKDVELLLQEAANISLERMGNDKVKIKDDKLIAYSSVIQKEIEITFPVRKTVTKSGGRNKTGRDENYTVDNSTTTTDGTSNSAGRTSNHTHDTGNSTNYNTRYDEDGNIIDGPYEDDLHLTGSGENSRTSHSHGRNTNRQSSHSTSKQERNSYSERTSTAEEQMNEIVTSTEYVVIPILIKADIIYTDIDNIINMLEPVKHDKSMSSRWMEYKSGGITLSEFLFATDLVKAYKKNKLKDKEGLMDAIQRKRNSGNSKLISHGMKGYEVNYNMYIISGRDKIKLNKHLAGDVFKDKYKERFLSQASGMTLNIVDLDYERLTMFTKDIKGKSDVSFKAVSKRKDSGDNYTEMVKAIMSNRSPVF